ncbi:neocarzinostatin apoprotein domain-containing protein [Actinospongicola halichondriae]|uniref:neocarzinostatin apoprotein domain-containing protein n=1 Tax=Actinospongicola halichondriae TaxID=3236844 RepID=UPI003D49D713
MTTPDPTPEDQVRRSAARFHDHVLGTVDLDAALSRSQRSSRRPAALAVSMLAVVALIAAVVILRPPSDDVDVAIDEDGLSTTIPDDSAPVPDFENAPAPIGLGAPDDGKDSVRLPVIVEPPTGLVDGQMVSVSGQGFAPDTSIGVVMCTKEAGVDHGARGIEACDISHYGQGMSDAQGNATVEFRVQRIVPFDGEEVDCASEPGRCIVGMGMISDYDQSGGFAVDFDPSVPLPDPPTVELGKTEGIADGETVPIVVTGLAPNSVLFLQQCTDGYTSCAETSSGEQRVDSSGRFEGTVRLWRSFGTYGDLGPTNVDCAVAACELVINGDTGNSRAIPNVSIAFDPTRGARTPPVLRLLDDGPFSPGDTFRVAVDGLGEFEWIDLQVCPAPDGECIAWGSQGPGEASVVEVTVDSGSAACASGCPIIAYVNTAGGRGPGGTSGPPPLFPEPILVTITG